MKNFLVVLITFFAFIFGLAASILRIVTGQWIHAVIRIPLRIAAVLVSWYLHSDILLAIFHYIFGIPYLIVEAFKGALTLELLSTIANYYF